MIVQKPEPFFLLEGSLLWKVTTNYIIVDKISSDGRPNKSNHPFSSQSYRKSTCYNYIRQRITIAKKDYKIEPMFMILFNLIDGDVKVIDKIQTYTKLTKYQETAVAPDITKKIDCSCTEQIQLISSESIQSRNSRNRNNS